MPTLQSRSDEQQIGVDGPGSVPRRPAPMAPPVVATTRSPGRRAGWRLYLALLPLLLIIAAFAYFPALSAVFWSFFDWEPAGVSSPLGLGNYAEMLRDGIWWSSFRNLGLIFLFTVASWVLPLLAAELLITVRSLRWRSTIRTLLILPMAFPGVVTALIWGSIYDPNTGALNALLKDVGLGSLAHDWLGDPHVALIALLFIGFPFIAGLPVLIFTTSLQDIPQEIFEAASLDGAGRWRRLWRIDLPLMASQIRILIFLAIVGTLQYGFVAYVLTQGGPDNATTVPILRIISVAFAGGDWGYAAALSTTLFLLTFALSAVVALRQPRGDQLSEGGAM